MVAILETPHAFLPNLVKEPNRRSYPPGLQDKLISRSILVVSYRAAVVPLGRGQAGGTSAPKRGVNSSAIQQNCVRSTFRTSYFSRPSSRFGLPSPKMKLRKIPEKAFHRFGAS